jgi:hypothetical protein
MIPLNALAKFCATGTAEGERHLLSENVFIPPRKLGELLSMSRGSPRVLVGPKGIGKSYLLEHILATSRQRNIPSLILRPDDLDLASVADAKDIGRIKKAAYESLIAGVAQHIGSTLEGMLKGDAARLYKTAVDRGRRPRDWIGQVLTFLAGVSKPITDVDGLKLAQKLVGSASTALLAESVASYLQDSQGVMFLMLDDTDQVAAPDDPAHLNRIWGVVLAARKLAAECPNVRLLITLRLEVWSRLLRDDRGQRDQIDHIRPLVASLRADDEFLGAVIDRRVQLAAAMIDAKDKSNAYATFFHGDRVVLPTSEETRTWRAFLTKSARERPRDMIQLVAHLTAKALGDRKTLITSAHAEAVMATYSQERLDDVSIEVGSECPAFSEVVRSFADLRSTGFLFRMNFEELRSHLRSVPSRFSTMFRGRALPPDDDDTALKLLRLLHEAGVVNPRVGDVRRDRGFRHVNFADEPSFVSRDRWNEMQAADWEIHPAFRDCLMRASADRLAMRM